MSVDEACTNHYRGMYEHAGMSTTTEMQVAIRGVRVNARVRERAVVVIQVLNA